MNERDRIHLAIQLAELNGFTHLAEALRALLWRHENRELAVVLLPDLCRR